MRRFLAALLFAVSSYAQSTIAVDVVQTRVHMPVSVNGEEPVTFILDTGAVKSPIDPEYAKTIGIRAKSSGTAHGAGGVVKIGIAPDVTMSFAGLRSKVDRSPMTPLGAISLRIGQPVHGVLGFDVLHKYVVEIDYANERVTFHPRSFTPPRDAVRVPIRFDGHLPLVDARITLPDGREIPARLLVDTGAGAALVLTRSFTKKHNITIPGIEISAGLGVGGETRELTGRMPRLQLGGFTFENVVAGLSRDQKGVLSHSGFDGLVGGSLLRRFTLYVDYGRRNFAMIPNAAIGEPFEFTMTGALLTTKDDTFTTVVVRDVIGGSPAAEAGLRVGDELRAIDGKAVVPAQLDEIGKLFRQPDRRYALTIVRNGAEQTVTLLTRRLL